VKVKSINIKQLKKLLTTNKQTGAGAHYTTRAKDRNDTKKERRRKSQNIN
jgi:hypothetical protein